METILIKDVLEATGGRLKGGHDRVVVTDVSIDSRTIPSGALFVALPGARQDGHEFVAQAAGRGAAGALVAREVAGAPLTFAQVVVDQPLAAFQALAGWYRKRMSMPVIGVTGSNGKTMTKELTAHVLGAMGEIHKNAGNLNNELGVPLTLFGLHRSHRAAVVEMGINHFGEMRRLTAMVKPTLAVITNIGPVHTEFLGDVAGVARAKAEILEGMAPQSTVVMNGDDPGTAAFVEAAKKVPCRLVKVGMTDGCDVHITEVAVTAEGTHFSLAWAGRKVTARLALYGVHQARNAALAAGAAWQLNVSSEAIAERLASFQPGLKGRFRTVERGGIMFLDDSYNANPVSMRAALDVAAGWACQGRRVAVLGDMFELGAERQAAHEAIGDAVKASRFDYFVAVGPQMKAAADKIVTAWGSDRVVHVESTSAAVEAVRRILRPGDVVLVKGSRGMHLEDVIEGVSPVAMSS